MEYEDQIMTYLNSKPGCWSMEISKLTDDPEKFIAAVKYLIDGEFVKDIGFNNDYTIIKKEEKLVGIKEIYRMQGKKTLEYLGKTYQL